MEYIEIAKAVKPHGIKGEIKLAHYCDSPDNFYDFDTVYVKEGSEFKPVKILNIRTDNTSVYVKLDIVKTRNDAEDIRGMMFYVDKNDIENIPDDAFMVRDLIGVEVFDEDGKNLGVLKEILQHGAADVYVVKNKQKGFMFPALKQVILDIDIEKRTLLVDKTALSEVCVYED